VGNMRKEGKEEKEEKGKVEKPQGSKIGYNINEKGRGLKEGEEMMNGWLVGKDHQYLVF
jgi:hypothetical protein